MGHGTYSVLVDDVDNTNEFPFLGSLSHEGHTAGFHEFTESLYKHKINSVSPMSHINEMFSQQRSHQWSCTSNTIGVINVK